MKKLVLLLLLISGTAYAGTLMIFTSDDSVPSSGVVAVQSLSVPNPNTALSCPPGQVVMIGTNGSYCSE